MLSVYQVSIQHIVITVFNFDFSVVAVAVVVVVVFSSSLHVWFPVEPGNSY